MCRQTVSALGISAAVAMALLAPVGFGASPAEEYTILSGPAHGINARGDVLGEGMYVFRRGAYEPVSLTIPSAGGPMEAFGINSRADIVGHYFNATDPPVYSPLAGVHGFLVSGSGSSIVDVPGAWGTVATAINARGDIVGYYFQPEGDLGRLHGFLRRNGKFTTIDVPGSETLLWGINAQGDMVGNYLGPNGSRGFVYRDGRFSDVLFNSGGGVVSPHWAAAVTGINEDGDIVGYTVRPSGQWIGYVRYSDDPPLVFGHVLTAPGASSTIPRGINAAGDIVGSVLIGIQWKGFLLRRR